MRGARAPSWCELLVNITSTGYVSNVEASSMQLPWLQHLRGCPAAGRGGYPGGHRGANSSALPAQQAGNISPARGWWGPGRAALSGNISPAGGPALAAPAQASIFAAGPWREGIWAHRPGMAASAQARNSNWSSSSAGDSDTAEAPDAPPASAAAASEECQSDAGELCFSKWLLPAATMKL